MDGNDCCVIYSDIIIYTLLKKEHANIYNTYDGIILKTGSNRVFAKHESHLNNKNNLKKYIIVTHDTYFYALIYSIELYNEVI